MTSHETPESRLAELLRARKEARSGTTHDASTTRFGALAAQPQQVAVPPRKRTVPDGSHPRTEHRVLLPRTAGGGGHREDHEPDWARVRRADPGVRR